MRGYSPAFSSSPLIVKVRIVVFCTPAGNLVFHDQDVFCHMASRNMSADVAWTASQVVWGDGSVVSTVSHYDSD